MFILKKKNFLKKISEQTEFEGLKVVNEYNYLGIRINDTAKNVTSLQIPQITMCLLAIASQLLCQKHETKKSVFALDHILFTAAA